MPRSAASSAENTFKRGVVTEFTGLNFPENACTDALNCIFTDEGKVTRRKGINYESSYTLIAYAISNTTAVNSYFWQNIGGNSSRSMVAVQIGTKIEFFEVSGSTALSDNYKSAYQVDLETHKAAGGTFINTRQAQFASGNGRLYVAHPNCEPFFVYYDEDTDNMLTTELDIKIRDFTVIDDGVDDPENLFDNSTWSREAEYNLKNQGWKDRYLEAWRKDNDGDGTRPAKSMLWWYFRIPAGVDEPETDIKGLDFKSGRRDRFSTAGNSFAPRGFYTLDAFYQDRSAKVGGNIPVTTSGAERPSCIAFLNGRIIYAGTNADKYSNVIYFSNIIRDLDQKIRFYQNGDPTSEVSYELLPNDGGNIVIPEAGRIVYMKQIADMLLLIATNGVWTVSGSEAVGFTATDYTVNKLSDNGVETPSSVVIADNTPLWWNSEGIYTFTSDKGVVSVSKETIQGFYDLIPLQSKLHAKGAYNPLTNEITWVYSSQGSAPHNFDRALCFNVLSGGFYPYSFVNTAVIRDIIQIRGLTTEVSTENVVDENGANVVDGLGAQVTASVETSTSRETSVKFLVQRAGNITWADISNESYKDWEAVSGGSSYSSYFITGYKPKGGGNRKFQSPYITVHTETVTNGSCYMQGVWDYANDPEGYRYTNQQQIYGPNDYKKYAFRRLKVRGNGIALQMRFEADGNNPFIVTGWGTLDMVNQNV